MTEKKFKLSNWFTAFYAALFVGIVLRVVLYLVSTGTNDIRSWEIFARRFELSAFFRPYVDPALNHPPLAYAFAWCALVASSWLGLGFPYVFKLPSVLADIGTVFLVAAYIKAQNRAENRSAGEVFSSYLYALSVPSIFIASYHGNTDAICVFFLVLSIYLLEIRHRIFGAGFMLALAANIKLLPLIVVLPAFATFSRPRARLVFLAGLAVGIAPLAIAAALGGSLFRTNLFAYRSILQHWGINFFLWPFGNKAVVAYHLLGGKLIIGAIVTLSFLQWLWRPFSQTEVVTLAICIFLILAPGFGIQYLIYIAPFIVIASPVWASAFFVCAAVFCGTCYLYFLSSYWPLASSHSELFPLHVAVCGAVTFLLLIYFAACYSGRLVRVSRQMQVETGKADVG